MLGKWLLKQFRDSRHETIDEVLAMFQQSSDFSVYPLKKESKTLYIGYYQTMIDSTA